MRSGLNATLLEYVRSFAPETTMQDDTKRNNKKAPSKCYEPQKLDRKITKLLASEFGTVPDSFRLE